MHQITNQISHLNLKEKVILALKHHAMWMYGEVEVTFHVFLTSGLDRGESVLTHSPS
jgi:hypothetical protein